MMYSSMNNYKLLKLKNLNKGILNLVIDSTFYVFNMSLILCK